MKKYNNDKIVIVMNYDDLPTDQIVWLAESIYSLTPNNTGFYVEKHRYVQNDRAKKYLPLPIDQLPDLITTTSYRKLNDVQDAWLVKDGYL